MPEYPNRNTPDKHNSDNTTKKLSTGMMVAAWVAALLLMSQFFGMWQKNQNNPNTQPVTELGKNGSHRVLLERNRAGHYVSSGKINDIPVTFMLDTGATNVVIPGDLASKMGLPILANSAASTANGTVSVYRTRINKLTLGNINLYNVDASINPSMNGEQQILLGMSALKKLGLIQKGRTLTLIQR